MNKRLEKARERFRKACENKDPKAIAVALYEILIYDPIHSENSTQALMLVGAVGRELNLDDIGMLTRKQLKNLVKEKREKIRKKELSKERERHIVKLVVDALIATCKNKDRFMRAVQDKLKTKQSKKAESKIRLFSFYKNCDKF